MSELPEWWTGPYPEVSSAKTAADYIDALGGALSRRQENGHWVLTTGTQDLVRADTESELDTFVLGFALAHLIVERHGLIGHRPGPAAAPETAVATDMAAAETAPAAPAAPAAAAEPPGLSVVPDEAPGGDIESSAAADLEPGDDSPDADAGAGGGGGGGGGARRRGGRNRRR